MSHAALLLVVLAAFTHASWNFLLKKTGGGLGILALSSLTGCVLLTPVALFLLAGGYRFSWPAIGMLVGSGAIHMAYFVLLDRAYRAGGDLSVVYPLARATGPLLTIVAATLFFGEHMTPIALAGALTIALSALMLTGRPRALLAGRVGPAAGFAVLCGCMIAVYTVWDKQAVAVLLIPPIVFDWGANLARLTLLLPYARWREPGGLARAWRQHRRAAIAIGILSPLSYILVLFAMVTTPVSYVAPARELSILFAALLGAHALKEGDALRRSLAAAGMVLGIAALALG